MGFALLKACEMDRPRVGKTCATWKWPTFNAQWPSNFAVRTSQSAPVPGVVSNPESTPVSHPEILFENLYFMKPVPRLLRWWNVRRENNVADDGNESTKGLTVHCQNHEKI